MNHWKNPAHFARCAGKAAYRYESQAESVARNDSRKTGELIIAYTCFDCGHFHIGHADLSQRLAHKDWEQMCKPAPKVIVPDSVRTLVEQHRNACCSRCRTTLPLQKLVDGLFLSNVVPLYCSNTCKSAMERKRRQLRKQAERLLTQVAENQHRT